MSRARRLLIERGWLLGIAALALYVAIAPPHVVDGDNAEMSALGAVGGAAHPTGYPTYLLWLRAMSWLPGATPAHTAAIATALLGAISIVVLHAACRAWGASAAAASLTAAMYAVAPVVLRYSSEAEVFAMNGLVAATILWLAAVAGPLRGIRRVAALGLVAGLGLGDHVTCVLVAPVGLLGAVRGVREAERHVLAVGAGLAGVAVGLSTYGYLLVTPENAVSWGGLDGPGALADHFLRRAYGGAGSFSPRGGELHVAANLVALARTLGRTWLWLPFAGGLAMLGYRVARAGAGEPRSGWRLLALAFVLAGPLLAARFDVEPTGMGLYVVRRFHLLPAILLAPAIAIALDRVARPIRVRASVVVLATLAVFAGGAAAGFVEIAPTRTPAVERALETTLARLPPRAVVLLSGDIWYLGTGYLQVARGMRPDVTVALWHFVGVRWFRDRLARSGLALPTSDDDATPSVTIAESILASGRPLFVDLSLGNILKQLPSYPYGTLFRILPRGTATAPLDEVVAQNRTWFQSLDLDYPPPGLDDEYPAQIHAGYAATWMVFAEAYAAEGRHDDARAAAALAGQLTPR